jgi:hypothetical protein
MNPQPSLAKNWLFTQEHGRTWLNYGSPFLSSKQKFDLRSEPMDSSFDPPPLKISKTGKQQQHLRK